MFKWFKKRLLPPGTYTVKELKVNIRGVLPKIPEGWFVYEMGQSMQHMLWHCQMIYFDDLINKVKKPRRVWSEEHDTPQEAMQACIDAISKGDFI